MVLPDKDSFNAYGGPLSNYSPVVDPTTDEDARSRNRYAANVAMMTHTAVRAMRSFVGVDDGDPDDPGGFVHDAVWGSAPSVKPSVVRVEEGVWDLTWPATVDSALSSATVAQGGGSAHTVNFQRALAQVESEDGSFKLACAKVTGANTVRVYGYSGTALDDLAGLTITVWVW